VFVIGVVAALVAIAAPVCGEVLLPPGFTASVYVTGDGFAQPGGLPSSSTLVVAASPPGKSRISFPCTGFPSAACA